MTRKEPRPLKQGDVVRVYDGHIVAKGVVAEMGEGPSFPGAVRVVVQCGHQFTKGLYHEKQVRRLKPRKKPEPQEERVERWMMRSKLAAAFFTAPQPPKDGFEMIHLIELKSGEIPLSRDALERVWNEQAPIVPASENMMFKGICKALGFGGDE